MMGHSERGTSSVRSAEILTEQYLESGTVSEALSVTFVVK